MRFILQNKSYIYIFFYEVVIMATETIKDEFNKIFIHMKSGNGFYVDMTTRKTHKFNMSELELDEIQYVVENGEQVRSEWDIIKNLADIFEYTLCNDGEYEFFDSTSLYSKTYILKEEFEDMVRKARDYLKTNGDKYSYNSIHSVASTMEKLYPKVFIKIGHPSTICIQ